MQKNKVVFPKAPGLFSDVASWKMHCPELGLAVTSEDSTKLAEELNKLLSTQTSPQDNAVEAFGCKFMSEAEACNLIAKYEAMEADSSRDIQPEITKRIFKNLLYETEQEYNDGVVLD